jgi:hypothetical protein
VRVCLCVCLWMEGIYTNLGVSVSVTPFCFAGPCGGMYMQLCRTPLSPRSVFFFSGLSRRPLSLAFTKKTCKNTHKFNS